MNRCFVRLVNGNVKNVTISKWYQADVLGYVNGHGVYGEFINDLGKVQFFSQYLPALSNLPHYEVKLGVEGSCGDAL